MGFMVLVQSKIIKITKSFKTHFKNLGRDPF